MGLVKEGKVRDSASEFSISRIMGVCVAQITGGLESRGRESAETVEVVGMFMILDTNPLAMPKILLLV